jgi:arylamine N-acetyltransferase
MTLIFLVDSLPPHFGLFARHTIAANQFPLWRREEKVITQRQIWRIGQVLHSDKVKTWQRFCYSLEIQIISELPKRAVSFHHLRACIYSPNTRRSSLNSFSVHITGHRELNCNKKRETTMRLFSTTGLLLWRSFEKG